MIGTGTIIENLSGRKLTLLVIFLLISQSRCFPIGYVPSLENAQNILATAWKDTTTTIMKNHTTKCFITAEKVFVKRSTSVICIETLEVVFSFQMPVPRRRNKLPGGNKTIDLLHIGILEQNLIGALQLDLKYHSQIKVKPRSFITIDVRLAYKNKGDADEGWKLLGLSKNDIPTGCY